MLFIRRVLFSTRVDQKSHRLSHSRWLSVSLKIVPGACCYGGVLTEGLLNEAEEEGSTNGSTFSPLYSELRTA